MLANYIHNYNYAFCFKLINTTYIFNFKKFNNFRIYKK